MNPQIPQQSQSPEYTIRTHRPGDIGWIIHRHAALYENEQGWGTKMEALVCKVGAEFLDNYDVSIDRCWIAERNDEFLGCAVLVRDRELIDTAKLRLLLVEPSARGLGLGRALIEQCTRFARETGYARIRLWMQNVLVSARRLYANEGYRLVSAEDHVVLGRGILGIVGSWFCEGDVYFRKGKVNLDESCAEFGMLSLEFLDSALVLRFGLLENVI
ncbi:Transcriptional regulator [Penicillium digitatum]|uniref:Transcriptional regulator n=3 Tax=Penicillium digitatum TaxID=36651 RepID=K9GDM8_PEND2|nr:Transcriptional regulator [Penicillium digitatum Pd1]EKV11356.1 Transcriptional regulator [Penicillium digitatum PHI26]EKV20060.1 Transcriptional regulator [Penicillium digitatum Pd1]QQK39570.1 Transcriptional regulator [Penicillium digitatum]